MAKIEIEENNIINDEKLYESFIDEYLKRGGTDDAKLKKKIKTSFMQLAKSGLMIEEMSFEDLCRGMNDIKELRQFYESNDVWDLFSENEDEENEDFNETEDKEHNSLNADLSSKEVDKQENSEPNKKNKVNKSSDKGGSKDSKPADNKEEERPKANASKSLNKAPEFGEDRYIRYANESKELISKLNHDHRTMVLSKQDMIMLNHLKKIKFSDESFLESKFNSYESVIHAALVALYNVSRENDDIIYAFESAEAEIKVHNNMVERKLEELRKKYNL